ncbi:MAG: D-sedoheptulose 7-phosphate isomerase [Microscillaceae bacterium]|nr:D-sedoheptulose 7-phosphate isomerase [Microscillaceae bacterium]
MIARIKEELLSAKNVLEAFMTSERNLEIIAEAAQKMSEAILSGNKIFSAGNGGSHCDAMHFAEELTGRYRENRMPLPALAIADPSHLSCVSNDYGFEQVFSRYLEALGQPGDVLLAISTSGNSPNILKGAEMARHKGMLVIALTGKDGGKLASQAHLEIRVPHLGFADRIQEVHIKVIHILIMLIEEQVCQPPGE